MGQESGLSTSSTGTRPRQHGGPEGGEKWETLGSRLTRNSALSLEQELATLALEETQRPTAIDTQEQLHSL